MICALRFVLILSHAAVSVGGRVHCHQSIADARNTGSSFQAMNANSEASVISVARDSMSITQFWLPQYKRTGEKVGGNSPIARSTVFCMDFCNRSSAICCIAGCSSSLTTFARAAFRTYARLYNTQNLLLHTKRTSFWVQRPEGCISTLSG